MQSEGKIAIIGAGPAGLAALNAVNNSEVVVFERGSDLAARSQSDETSLLFGVGGAGLYSDGKFSYYPSASKLWQLTPQANLRKAYDWFRSMSENHGLHAPSYPTDIDPLSSDVPSVLRKNYRSDYLSLNERAGMIRDLSALRSNAEFVSSEIVEITLNPAPSSQASISVLANDGIARTFDALIIATGRFGPLLLHSNLDESLLAYKRAEIGVRIEQSSNEFLFQRDQQVDSKVILTDHNLSVQWRTFCCCRDGLVTPTSFGNHTIFSGRADCPPTGRSNIGFLMRMLDEKAGFTAWADWKRLILESNAAPVTTSLEEFISNPGEGPLADMYGSNSALLLAEGIRRLLRYLGVNVFPRAELHAPVIEGVGLYPAVDSGLRAGKYPVWAAGDVSGEFRGIVAALVSGFFCGLAAEQHVQSRPTRFVQYGTS